MIHLGHAFIFVTMISFAWFFKPDCEVHNQFKHDCILIESCTQSKCSTNICGYYFNNTIVKVLFAKRIPTCAFSDSPFLKQVIARNKKIQVLASGAFSNLPGLELIDLSLNEINVLIAETFKNVAANALDLSWNKLKYIQDRAFDGLSNLQYLNLSRNELTTFPVHHVPKKLLSINLSYNLFERFVISSNRAPTLTHLDLSHNKLGRLALQFENELKMIDLSKNDLVRIDFADVSYCEEVKISANRFSTIPDILTLSSLRKAAISPNPWKCDELERLWPILSMNSVKLLDDEVSSQSSQPVCGDVDFASRLLDSQNPARYCEQDAECEDNEFCRYNSCVDPCTENVCDSSRVCDMFSHNMVCACRGSWKQDPENPLGPCQDVECFSTSDCFRHRTYCQNNTCVLQPGVKDHPYPLPRPTYPPGRTTLDDDTPPSSTPSPFAYAAPARGGIEGFDYSSSNSEDGKSWWEDDI